MHSNMTMPVTGGLFSTDGLIVVGVIVAFVIGYIIFCLLRENSNNDLKEFKDDDFINDEQTKQ